MSHIRWMVAGVSAVVLLGLASNPASAQYRYTPGWNYGGPIVTGGTFLGPNYGFGSVIRSYDPYWGTQSFNKSYYSPLTGEYIQKQIVAGPFGNSVNVRGFQATYPRSGFLIPGVNYNYSSGYAFPGWGYRFGSVRPGFGVTWVR